MRWPLLFLSSAVLFLFFQTSKVYNKNSVEKGIAFPTMVSVNDCVEYYSPTGDAGDDNQNASRVDGQPARR